jgi:hypothetical protein
MAKIKLTGHASGTGIITLTAPNTSTDRTITLPDATGTLLTADGDGSSLTGIALNSVTGDLTVSDDLILNSDSAAITFGAGADQKLVHVNDTGLVLQSTGTGDDVFPIFSLQPAQTEINNDDYLGMITFTAAGEASGTDAVATAASIVARAEADFTSSVNKTKLVFSTGDSGAATARLSLLSDGRGLSPFTAKAWVQFTGTGTVSIDGSHNISSVSDNGAGRYEPNFTNNMNNANYAMFTSSNGSAGGDSSWQDMDRNSFAPYSQTVSGFKMAGYYGGYQDCSLVCGLVFADGT